MFSETPITPRWYQTEADEALWAALFPFTARNPVIVLPTGAGKSVSIAMFCKRVLGHDGRAVILQHRAELCKQNFDKIADLVGLQNVGMYSAGLKSRELEQPIIVASIQSIYNKAHLLGRRHAVLADECFTGDTIISTARGDLPIRHVRPGDIVCNANGLGQVVTTRWKRTGEPIFKVVFNDGTSIECTGNHPIFTSHGWAAAKALDIGALVFGQEELQTLRRRVSASPVDERNGTGESGQRISMEQTGMLWAILCQEVEKPHEQSSGSFESQGEASRDQTQADKAGRQRAATSGGSISAAARVGRGVGVGIASSYAGARRAGRIPDLLQAGHWQHGKEDWDRTGRQFSRAPESAKTGQEKRTILFGKRVASVTCLERSGLRTVFNLRVSGHPSYFANGVLAHNCHLVPQDGEGMYRTFLDELAQVNPNLRIAGCTATPFRTDSGPICSPDGVFHKVAYSVPVARLIAEGFLCSVTNQATETAYDTSGLHVRGGEFVPREVEALFDSDQIKIDAACAEIVKKCHGRHSILVFCSGVRHCERVSATLARLSGEEVGIVVGTTGQLERAATLAAFRAGRMRFLCGVDVLTTGFDAPTIDAIAILRATESAGLLAQIIGRGFRIHESKTDCLVLDFGGNLERHGPIDSPDYGARRGGHGETTGEAPTKSCPNCHSCCAISATACAACGFEFPARELKHGTEADTRAALLSAPVVPVTWLVRDWHAGRHQKKWRRCDQGCQILGPGDVCRDCGTVRPVDTFRVDYTCDPTDREPTLIGEIISEWVCLEHSGFVQTRAFQWWGLHTLAPVPSGIDEALDMFAAGALGRPTEITTIQDGRFKKITGRVVPVRPATWAGESDEGGDSDDFAPREFAGASSEDIPF